MMLDLHQRPHRRFNPLTREWVLVSPHRTERPWLGQVERVSEARVAAYDPECYMCPGNTRATGARNPCYKGVFIFENDFSALCGDLPDGFVNEQGLIVARSEAGLCRVMCFSPSHSVSLASMPLAEIGSVVNAWAEQFRELSSRSGIGYVQIFENRGAMMGASNPHPHCQIWASASVPNEPAKEQNAQCDYLKAHGACLLCQYLEIERRSGERIVFENESFLLVVPYWAIWPFEVMVLPRRHLGTLTDLKEEERSALTGALQWLTSRYDRLFDSPFPYSMGFHQTPTDGQPHPEWHFHGHFYPPLLRSATVRKFMVGFEMLGTPQRDITAESAAAMLRETK